MRASFQTNALDWDALPAQARNVDCLPSPDEISNGAVFRIRNHESRYLTHKFHKYAGKFIPELPQWVFRSLRPERGAIVLDPFVGSGTTLVEASLYGVSAIGLDVDPMARLIAKVKTTPLDPAKLERATSAILADLPAARASGRRPEIPTLYHWFSPKAVEALSAIRGLIDRYEADGDLHDFLTICFSSIVRRASKADNQTMKTYVSHTHPKIPEDARQLFRATLIDYSRRLEAYSARHSADAEVTVRGDLDARTLAAGWEALKLPPVDLAITSPPYIKSVDYMYNQMAELFWIGDRWDLANQQQQNDFKRRYMGTDRPAAAIQGLSASHAVPDVSFWVNKIAEQNPKLAKVADRYFSDTVSHFRNMSRILRPGASYVYVVGNSTLAGVSVPTHRLVAACARASGFELSVCFGYEIQNKHMRFPRGGRGGQVVHDWVLVLRSHEGG
jgi:hypothetical protein